MAVPRTQPGRTAFTVAPYGARSCAALRTRPSNPALEAEYADMAGAPVEQAVDPTATNLPQPASFICGATRGISANAAPRLTESVRCQAARLISQMARSKYPQ